MRRLLVLASIALASPISYGQDAPPAFEVVSVKHSGSDVYVMRGPGSVTITSAPFRYSGEQVTCDLPLLAIIKEAFSVPEDYRIVGPEWLSTERYQIKAVPPAGTTKETAPSDAATHAA
ncbi:MAG TPA: TIGR03435 family protein [Candidatus Acidoferrum sp.]|nr:TIGR03435 family protein [Candidatus Acidoferrum sp.]